MDINLVGLGEFFITTVQVLKSKKLKINPKLRTFWASSEDFSNTKNKSISCKKKILPVQTKGAEVGMNNLYVLRISNLIRLKSAVYNQERVIMAREQ